MSFSDIFKNSFLDGFDSGVDFQTILICFAISTVLAFYIFLVYRITTRKTFYSKSFNISLVAMTVITTAVILTIQSNIVMSLGMVGALSIVRYRTAIKDPLDLVFLYWSTGIGIICGAGLSSIAVALCLLMSILIFIMQKYPLRKQSFVLVVNSDSIDNDESIIEVVKKFTKSYAIKSKNLTPTKLDMIIEIKVDSESNLIKEIIKIEGVTSASILSHDGDITA